MKKLILLVAFSFTQSVFALTGVIQSKIVGEKEVFLDFAAVRVLPSSISAEVSIDNDTQDMTCIQYLRFPSFAQALFIINGVRIQENMNAIVYLSSEKITERDLCKAKSVESKNLVAVTLEKVLNPSIVVSQRHVDDVLTPTILAFSGPASFISARLERVGPTHYTLKNIELPTELTLNFSVFTASQASVSYLEHGQVILK